MIEAIPGLPPDVVGLRAEGRVTKEEYAQQFMPRVEDALLAHGRVRVIYVLGADFDASSLAAIWQDGTLGLARLQSWERIAVVTEAGWMRDAVGTLGLMVPGEVRAFQGEELDAAIAWICA